VGGTVMMGTNQQLRKMAQRCVAGTPLDEGLAR